MSRRSLHPDTQIGHVHLRVADLERAIGFYRDVLGFEVTGRVGDQAAFLSAGGYHHHIGLNTFESKGGSPPPSGSTGLHHFAIRLPTREALSEAVRHLHRCGVDLDGASDHGASLAVYLRDPDDNGIELGWDRPQEEWPRAVDGSFVITREPLDLKSLLLAGDRSVDTSGGTRRPGTTPRELIAGYLAAARRGDWDAAFEYFAPEIVLRVPGRSAFAGEHRGREAAIGYIEAVRNHFRRGSIDLEVIDMLAGDDRVALLLCERFHGDGPPIEIRRANVYRVSGDQIVEITIFEADPQVVEALMAGIESC